MLQSFFFSLCLLLSLTCVNCSVKKKGEDVVVEEAENAGNSVSFALDFITLGEDGKTSAEGQKKPKKAQTRKEKRRSSSNDEITSSSEPAKKRSKNADTAPNASPPVPSTSTATTNTARFKVAGTENSHTVIDLDGTTRISIFGFIEFRSKGQVCFDLFTRIKFALSLATTLDAIGEVLCYQGVFHGIEAQAEAEILNACILARSSDGQRWSSFTIGNRWTSIRSTLDESSYSYTSATSTSATTTTSATETRQSIFKERGPITNRFSMYVLNQPSSDLLFAVVPRMYQSILDKIETSALKGILANSPYESLMGYCY